MKRSEDDEPTRFRDDPEFFTQQDIRTVDLASVAARLLGPRDDDYANAALRALRLMHVCASVLNRIAIAGTQPREPKGNWLRSGHRGSILALRFALGSKRSPGRSGEIAPKPPFSAT